MSQESKSFSCPPIRIGLGYDTHRLVDGGPLRLGGIDIAFDKHLYGHSDADVLLHAITDALLGATKQGDIGRLFPDDAEENRGRDSEDFLRAAIDRVRNAGYQLINLDCVVLAQRPKLAPHIDAVERRIAEILDVAVDCVGVKAKTGEKVGPVGREEAMCARCVALVVKTPV